MGKKTGYYFILDNMSMSYYKDEYGKTKKFKNMNEVNEYCENNIPIGGLYTILKRDNDMIIEVIYSGEYDTKY